MPSFNAETAVEALDYNFGNGVAGIIPEPSSLQIQEFLSAVKSTLNPALAMIKGAEANGPTEQDDAKVLVMFDAVYEAAAKVCSGTPSFAEIKALPFRVQRVFLGWLVGSFLNPES